ITHLLPPTALSPSSALSLHDALPISVPRVSIVGAPHLDARPRVPREDRDFAPTGRRDRVWLVRRKARSVAGRIETALAQAVFVRSEVHTSELQSRLDLVCRLLLEKKK